MKGAHSHFRSEMLGIYQMVRKLEGLEVGEITVLSVEKSWRGCESLFILRLHTTTHHVVTLTRE